MTNSFIDLSNNFNVPAAETIDCLKALDDKARDLDIDFFVVGAQARILVLEQYYGFPVKTDTLDIDIAITVNDWQQYGKLRDTLIWSKSFTPDPKVYHRIYFENQYPVDLIPFGALEEPPGTIQWPPDQDIHMNVTGFQNALNDTILVHLTEQLDVRFVSLPGMIVLKLIAWHDRHHEYPTKDASDIAVLLRYYPEAGNYERLYGEHADLIRNTDFDFESAGARMLGRDMTAIMTAQTRESVLEILDLYTNPDGNDSLVLGISRFVPDQDYEVSLHLLQNLKTGILDQYSNNAGLSSH